MELEDLAVNENEANTKIEENLYNEALKKFPELKSMNKEEVLRQMRTLSVNKPEQKQQQEDEDIPTRKIFIDHVLCNDTKFTDDEVRDHVYTIVAAGSETTALQTAHTSEWFMQINYNQVVNNLSVHFISYAARDSSRNSRKSFCGVEGSFLF